MIFTSVFTLLGLGLAAAAILAAASRLLYVKEDPRIAKVERTLPGANCGGCGYAGCAAAAGAIVAGEAPPDVCVVADTETHQQVAAIMGQAIEYREPKIAIPDCTGGERAEPLYLYEGALDCRAQHMLHGGGKMCPEGCLGLGSCVRACPFDAIHMGEHGYPVVDPDKCRACGKCEEACPRGVIAVLGMTQRLTRLNRTHDCLAPCRQRCPAQIDIPRYIERIRHGDYAGAVATIKETNPLLLACGRVCPHPCEEVCRRGNVDDPVAINNLKRFVADWERLRGERVPVACAPDTGRKAAIVGGGPAGLSCAYFLRRLGHSPVIFEALPELGGTMRYGIPEYRLPKKALDFEIQGILELGVEARTEVKFGRDITLDDFHEEGFEAVFLGIGAWQSSNLRAENEEAAGVMAGIEFLTGVGLGMITSVGKRAIVVGGGNTAIDAARTAVRLGAESVVLMYRRGREQMPANQVEIEAAEEEGVEFAMLSQPTRVIADDNGKATHLEFVRMELGEPDASGRRKPQPVEGSETRMEAGLIITAIGQKPDLSCLYVPSETGEEECRLRTSRYRTIEANPVTLQTSRENVFAGGDAYRGPALVVTAVGDGRRAARSIHQLLTQGRIDIPRDLQTDMMPQTLFTTVTGVDPAARVQMPEVCADERTCSFTEVDLTIDEADALAEAERCLHCGLTCYDRDQPVCFEPTGHPCEGGEYCGLSCARKPL
jgi:NADPH-dependent glutamate synthase beta subunit-like oxidoreductase